MSRHPQAWRGAPARSAARQSADEALADLAGRAIHFLASLLAVTGFVMVVILWATQVAR